VPAIAVGRALVSAGIDQGKIRFVGSRRGSEGRLVTEAGFAITLLPGRGIQRRLTLANLGATLGLGIALVQALGLVLWSWPRAVLSVGGYAGLPVAVAAVILRRPLVLAEANAVPGAANRLVARYARAAALSFAGTPLPRGVLTGNPVRPEILAINRSPTGRVAARTALGIPEGRVVIGVSGGSLGARRINQAARGLAMQWSDRSDIAIHHAVGRRDWPSFEAPLDQGPSGPSEREVQGLSGPSERDVQGPSGPSERDVQGPSGPSERDVQGLHYRAVEYEDRIDLVLTAADIWVGRAGGSTCAELGVAGVPGVLVPLPNAPGDHQTANAQAMAEAGAAVMIIDAECTPERLAEVLGPLVAGASGRAAMAAKATTMGHPDAAKCVAALLLEHAR